MDSWNDELTGQLEPEEIEYAEAAVFNVPRRPEGAALARRFLSEQLAGRADETTLARVQLAASELVSNAWKHGSGRIELRLALARDRLRLEVIDEGSGAISDIRRQDGDENGGWGLRIIDELALRWGCFEGTTHVWAELPLS